MNGTDPYKPHAGRIGQCMNHAPAILAAPAVYGIHGPITHQARGHQTIQNVNEKHTSSPLAATSNRHQTLNSSNFQYGITRQHFQ